MSDIILHTMPLNYPPHVLPLPCNFCIGAMSSPECWLMKLTSVLST